MRCPPGTPAIEAGAVALCAADEAAMWRARASRARARERGFVICRSVRLARYPIDGVLLILGRSEKEKAALNESAGQEAAELGRVGRNQVTGSGI